MSDFFLELGQNPRARKLIKQLGLPIPMPQALKRADGPRVERPLHDQNIVIGGGSSLGPVIAQVVTASGGNPFLIGDDTLVHAFDEPGEAYGRPSQVLEVGDIPEKFRVNALVFDATALASTASLRELYDFFHPLVRSVVRCGRCVVIGRDPDEIEEPAVAATQAALEGFVRSLAKELGKRGATAQLLYVEEGAEARADGPLRFLLSTRSAFVSGQPIRINREAKGDDSGPEVQSLEGKVALVTGAARGIGAATARVLAEEGARVVCLDRPEDDAPASAVAREVGGTVLLVDVTDENAPTIISEELKKQFGGVDIVVHNAGITRDKTIARMKEEWWDQAIDVNLGAVLRITDRLLADGTIRDGGRIICLSSIAGIAGNVGQTNYAASKSGIIGFVENLAELTADRGITVNAIAPGFIETRLTAAIPVMIREVGRRLSALGQGGLPRDIAEAITFLSMPGSNGITGSTLRVCGGALVGA